MRQARRFAASHASCVPFTIDASPAVVYRWVCQLSLAPYSLRLDRQLGRRSPEHLTPGADDVKLGQRMLTGPVVDIVAGEQITVVGSRRANRIFGEHSMTYQVVGRDRRHHDAVRRHCRVDADRSAPGTRMGTGRRRPSDDAPPTAQSQTARRVHRIGAAMSRRTIANAVGSLLHFVAAPGVDDRARALAAHSMAAGRRALGRPGSTGRLGAHRHREWWWSAASSCGSCVRVAAPRCR